LLYCRKKKKTLLAATGKKTPMLSIPFRGGKGTNFRRKSILMNNSMSGGRKAEASPLFTEEKGATSKKEKALIWGEGKKKGRLKSRSL